MAKPASMQPMAIPATAPAESVDGDAEPCPTPAFAGTEVAAELEVDVCTLVGMAAEVVLLTMTPGWD